MQLPLLLNSQAFHRVELKLFVLKLNFFFSDRPQQRNGKSLTLNTIRSSDKTIDKKNLIIASVERTTKFS